MKAVPSSSIQTRKRPSIRHRVRAALAVFRGRPVIANADVIGTLHLARPALVCGMRFYSDQEWSDLS
jgi:hypothetical protein